MPNALTSPVLFSMVIVYAPLSVEEEDLHHSYQQETCLRAELKVGGAMPNLFPKRIDLAPKMGIFYSTPY